MQSVLSVLRTVTISFSLCSELGLLYHLHVYPSPSRAVNVHMPRDRITQLHQNYGFVEFMGEEDADYAIKIMNMIKLYGKPIRVNKVWKITCLYYWIAPRH